MSELIYFPVNKENHNANTDHTAFEMLYDKYSSKVYGFIMLHTNSKPQAEEFLISVFLKVWEDIKNFTEDDDRKITRILLLVCRPLFKVEK